MILSVVHHAHVAATLYVYTVISFYTNSYGIDITTYKTIRDLAIINANFTLLIQTICVYTGVLCYHLYDQWLKTFVFKH